MATYLTCALRAVDQKSLYSGNKKLSAHQFSGRFLSPRVFSAYTVLKILPISYRYQCLFCAFGAKGMGREKINIRAIFGDIS